VRCGFANEIDVQLAALAAALVDPLTVSAALYFDAVPNMRQLLVAGFPHSEELVGGGFDYRHHLSSPWLMKNTYSTLRGSVKRYYPQNVGSRDCDRIICWGRGVIKWGWNVSMGRQMCDSGGECLRLKRYALQLVAQLPDSRDEAMKVLEYARELIDWEAENDPAPVLQLIG
jgi:hypothetical protein